MVASNFLGFRRREDGNFEAAITPSAADAAAGAVGAGVALGAGALTAGVDVDVVSWACAKGPINSASRTVRENNNE